MVNCKVFVSLITSLPNLQDSYYEIYQKKEYMCLHLCFEMNICRLNLENYNKQKNFFLVSVTYDR